MINAKIKTNLFNLASVLQTKHNQIKPHIFYLLSANLNNNDEAIKSQIIISKISNALKIFYDLYKYFHYTQKIKNSFSKWRFNTMILKQKKILEPKIEEKYYKKLSQKKEEISSANKAAEANLNNIKKQIANFNEGIMKMKKIIKNNEEKELSYNNKIKSLESEISFTETEIKKTINGETAGKETKKAKLESRVKELESSLKTLEDDMKEKDTYFNAQIKDFNDMLSIFEAKSKELSNMKSKKEKASAKSPLNHNIASISYKIDKNNYKTNPSSGTNASSRGIFISVSNNYNSNKK